MKPFNTIRYFHDSFKGLLRHTLLELSDITDYNYACLKGARTGRLNCEDFFDDVFNHLSATVTASN